MGQRKHNTHLPIVEGLALTPGKPNVIREEFPVGPGGSPWWKILMKFTFGVTIGTGTGAKSEALMGAVQDLTLESSLKEKFLDKCPSRHLYRDMIVQSGVQEPEADTFAAASGDYVLWLEHNFIDRRMLRPWDTVFDSSLYKWLKMTIGLGTIADLLDTPGTATLDDVTLDMWALKVDGTLPAGIRGAYRELGVYPPVDPASQAYIDPEKDPTLELNRLQVYTTENADDGIPFTGELSNDVIDNLTISRISPEAGSSDVFPEMPADAIRRMNQPDYQLESVLTGVHYIDFTAAEGSHLRNVKPDGAKFRIGFDATEGSTDPQVTAGYVGIRKPR